MENYIFVDKGQRKRITSEELRALICPSDSEDGLEFDDSDDDPTVDYKTIVSQQKELYQSSDSEEDDARSEKQTVVVKIMPGYCVSLQ